MKGVRDTSHPEVVRITSKILKAIELTGQQVEQPELVSPQQAKILKDSTLLNAQDIASNKGRVEEALLANWTVKAWYFADNLRTDDLIFPAKFWRKILPDITVPIYSIDQFSKGMGQLREVSKEEMMRRLT